MSKILAAKKIVISVFLVLGFISAFLLGDLKFSFDFNQFFPQGDEDIIFYTDFMKDFGADDSFLLIAVENDKTIFEKKFLADFHKFSLESRNLPYIKESKSLTTLFYPIKTSFGYTRIPIIHWNDSSRYKKDWKKLKKDGIFLNSLIDKDANSLVVALDTKDELNYEESLELIGEVQRLLSNNNLEEYHLLGRSSFYKAMVKMQKREVQVTTLVSTILVFLILLLVYKRITIVFISLFSIVTALLLFLGLLSLLGKELNVMASFYPVLMLIVGTSDVIHIMDRYLGELRKGLERYAAITITLKGVGVSTLLTSVTTAVGFASLLTSKSTNISAFGFNSAIGVMVAFLTVITLTSSLLITVKKKHLLPKNDAITKWPENLSHLNRFTRRNSKAILLGSLVFVVCCSLGVTNINTNYQFNESLPKGSEIANDFKFFQENYNGFRPLEIAILAKEDNKVTDLVVAKEIEKIEDLMNSNESVGNVQSMLTFFKFVNKAHHLNKEEYYKVPKDGKTYEKYKLEAKKLARSQLARFVDSTETKGRITATVLDIGTDSLLRIYDQFNSFIKNKTDTTLVNFKLTGKGLLLDKNSMYVRQSLLEGLVIASIIVGLLMVVLFKNIKLLLISLVPNLLSLLFAGALLGFFAIPLEASISIVFAIVFGIAVDDTIHFLSRYKQCRTSGLNQEESLEKTFQETGKALVITTIILFFGFMVMLFSIHQPSVTVGLLISFTLLVALALDLLLLPVIIRKLL